jgi:hypothetical protein
MQTVADVVIHPKSDVVGCANSYFTTVNIATGLITGVV